MNKSIIKILVVFLILFGLTKNINADEPKPSDSHQFNFFSGVFDINTSSKKSSELFGIQHSNEDLFREHFFRKVKSNNRVYDDNRFDIIPLYRSSSTI